MFRELRGDGCRDQRDRVEGLGGNIYRLWGPMQVRIVCVLVSLVF